MLRGAREEGPGTRVAWWDRTPLSGGERGQVGVKGGRGGGPWHTCGMAGQNPLIGGRC